MSNNINTDILHIIKKTIKFDEGEMIDESSRLEDLNIDSLKFVTIIVEIESHFDLQFDDEMLLMKEFPNILSLIQYVKTKKEKK